MDNNQIELLKKISKNEKILIVQDLDGVCIPLVKDPLKRIVDLNYLKAANELNGEFCVLTNGEHDGKRGVNRLVESAYGEIKTVKDRGLYLPGLAAGGVEHQDRFGQTRLPGVTRQETEFLKSLPLIMVETLNRELTKILPFKTKEEIAILSKKSVLDTNYSPTININYILNINPRDIAFTRSVQSMLLKIMNILIQSAQEADLKESFHLHIAPNLGCRDDGTEIIKFSENHDIGTTDIQFMISGAVKEAGLLVLINKYIKDMTGKSPLGDDFNVRTSPKSIKEMKELCKENIPTEQMPLLIGVGDTITSTKSSSGLGWQRGGSDRGFLTLIQELGAFYGDKGLVLIVDSSYGEVERPSLKGGSLKGVSDPDDPLKFNCVFENGPKEYIEWFKELSKMRGAKKTG